MTSIWVPVTGRTALGDFGGTIAFVVKFARRVHSIRDLLIGSVSGSTF